MKKKVALISLIFLLGLGGFFVVKAMNGEATALNDSFTKEFISQEWIEDEFHLFESKTGQYRMLFPDQFQMISDPPEFYGRQGDYYEHWSAQVFKDSNNGISYYFKVKFKESERDLSESHLNIMLEDHSYKHQHQELVSKETFIYHGSSFWNPGDPRGEKKDPSKVDANRFFGLVLDAKTNRSVEFVYSTICYKEELGCELNSAQQYELALNLMKSIKFLD